MYWLGAENLLALTAFKNMLLLKAYSPATIKNYMNKFHQLLRLLGNRSVNSLGKEQVMDIIGEIKNIKHKVMIMAGYSAGLRVSEIVGS
jgi:integrase/recombinase XerD